MRRRPMMKERMHGESRFTRTEYLEERLYIPVEMKKKKSGAFETGWNIHPAQDAAEDFTLNPCKNTYQLLDLVVLNTKR